MVFPVFATPSLSHSVSLEYFRSFMETSQLLQQAGITHTSIQVGGDCYLAHARNRLVHTFLNDFPEATDLFFLDDDIGWPAEAVLRLLRDEPDVVAGIYPHKQDDVSYPVSLEMTDGHAVQVDGLFLAKTVPTGFLRIRRHVLETMAAASAIYAHKTATGVDTVHEVFRMGAYDGEWWGEDIDFCNRWRAMGGTIWVDADITFTHSGRKQWRGRLMDSARPAQQEAAE